jgi:hypothetical protein
VLFDKKFGTVLCYSMRDSELVCVISKAGFSLNLCSRFGIGNLNLRDVKRNKPISRTVEGYMCMCRNRSETSEKGESSSYLWE